MSAPKTLIQRVTDLVTTVMRLKPYRAWTHLGARNGMVLAAGTSYQALFALFAALYVAFSIVGLWLGTSRDAMNGLIDTVNGYLPGVISDGGSGLLSRDQVIEIAAGAAGILSITGVVAFAAVVMTSIGWVSFSRIGVRQMLGLDAATGNPILMQARDLLAAVVFGALLLVGSTLASAGTILTGTVLDSVQLGGISWVADAALFLVSYAVSFGVNLLMLRLYFRFLTDAPIPRRLIWPGSLVGGAGLAALQVLAGALIGGTPSNPLLAAFAVLIGLLLFFRLIFVVLLYAASWIRVSADDIGIELRQPTLEERQLAEEDALIVAARVRLREAERERRHAPWHRRRRAAAAVRDAQDELRRLQDGRREERTAA